MPGFAEASNILWGCSWTPLQCFMGAIVLCFMRLPEEVFVSHRCPVLSHLSPQKGENGQMTRVLSKRRKHKRIGGRCTRPKDVHGHGRRRHPWLRADRARHAAWTSGRPCGLVYLAWWATGPRVVVDGKFGAKNGKTGKHIQ